MLRIVTREVIMDEVFTDHDIEQTSQYRDLVLSQEMSPQEALRICAESLEQKGFAILGVPIGQ